MSTKKEPLIYYHKYGKFNYDEYKIKGWNIFLKRRLKNKYIYIAYKGPIFRKCKEYKMVSFNIGFYIDKMICTHLLYIFSFFLFSIRIDTIEIRS